MEPGPAIPPASDGRTAVTTTRLVATGVIVAAVAAFGALILGEYDFTGFTPYVSGVLFGLVVAEVALAGGRTRAGALAPIAATAVAGGLVWAGWISTDHFRASVPVGVGLGPAIGAVVGYGWVRWSATRGASRRPAPPDPRPPGS